MLNEGSDGLGSGKPAEVRLSLFALQNEAARRRFCSQFEQQFLRPIVEQYSPYDHTQDFGMDIKPFLDDKSDMAEYIERVGKYMRNEDVVEKLDLPTIDDEEMAGSYRPPKQIEEAEEEDQQQGGLFGSAPTEVSFRSLAVPDNAVAIDDRSEAPEGAQIVEGDRGGLYYVPAGEDAGEDDFEVSDEGQESISRIEKIAQEEGGELGTFEQRSDIAEIVQEYTGVETSFRGDLEESAEMSKHLIRMEDAGQLDRLSSFAYSLTDMPSKSASGHYNKQTRQVSINPDVIESEQLEEWEEVNHIGGSSMEWVVTHEVGHHNHVESIRERDDMELKDLTKRDLTEDEEAMIQDELSDYAASQPLELVAEMYAGKAQGREFSEGMESLYDEFGGPEVDL
jgi:hypothetical protein